MTLLSTKLRPLPRRAAGSFVLPIDLIRKLDNGHIGLREALASFMFHIDAQRGGGLCRRKPYVMLVTARSMPAVKCSANLFSLSEAENVPPEGKMIYARQLMEKVMEN